MTRSPAPLILVFFLALSAKAAFADAIKVTSRVSGVIKSIEVRQGDIARAGDTLARLDDDMAKIEARKARAVVKAAEAEELETKRHLERQRVMAKRGLIPPSELEDAETTAAKAVGKAELARARLAEAELNLKYTAIKAPLSGRVSRILTHVGQVIRLDVEVTPLFEITPSP